MDPAVMWRSTKETITQSRRSPEWRRAVSDFLFKADTDWIGLKLFGDDFTRQLPTCLCSVFCVCAICDVLHLMKFQGCCCRVYMRLKAENGWAGRQRCNSRNSLPNFKWWFAFSFLNGFGLEKYGWPPRRLITHKNTLKWPTSAKEAHICSPILEGATWWR